MDSEREQPVNPALEEVAAAVAPEPSGQRDSIRRNFLRANTAVATQAFDRDLQQYAVGWANGDIVVRRVSDNQVVQWCGCRHFRPNGISPGQFMVGAGVDFKANAA